MTEAERLLKKISDTGILYQCDLALDAEVANYLARSEQSGGKTMTEAERLLRDVQSYLLEHDHEFLDENPDCAGCQLQERIAACLARREKHTELGKEGMFKEAVIDALVVLHIYRKEHDTNPRAAIADLIALEIQIATDPRVNGGMVMVPREPTQEMLEAAQALDEGEDDPLAAFRRVYKAMLSAAKEPQ